jgi:hypothetical protein
MGKTKDLSKDCKNIVLNLFKFFQLEKARGRPFYSPDNLIKRTCKAAGISYSSVYRVVNGKSPPESNRPKERKKTLDDFDRCIIKRTVYSMYNRKIAPTVSKIKKEIEDTIKISKSTLTLTCKAINLLPFHEGIFGASEPSTGNQPHVVSGMILINPGLIQI